MRSDEFARCVADFFQNWLRLVAFQIRMGQRRIVGPYSFPSLLRVGESKTQLMAELIGAVDIPPGQIYRIRLPTKVEKVKSATAFFNPGMYIDESKRTIFTFSREGQELRFTGMALCGPFEQEQFLEKIDFPISRTRLLAQYDALPLIISPNAAYVLLGDIDLVRTENLQVLYRYISTGIVVQKAASKNDVLQWLQSVANSTTTSRSYLLGLNVRDDPTPTGFSRQLLGLSDLDMTEASLDRFLQVNSDHFARSLGYVSAIPQLQLEWIERATDDPKISKPDYMMEREDGYYDILDLKRAALKYKITVGKKARMRFGAYANELIGQLVGYERYFKSKQNSLWAEQKYGVRVQNPRLVGLVGNYDNFVRDEVDTSLEAFKDNITIMSYRDLSDLARRRETFVLKLGGSA